MVERDRWRGGALAKPSGVLRAAWSLLHHCRPHSRVMECNGRASFGQPFCVEHTHTHGATPKCGSATCTLSPAFGCTLYELCNCWCCCCPGSSGFKRLKSLTAEALLAAAAALKTAGKHCLFVW